MRYKIFLVFFFLLINNMVSAQEYPNQELRSAWVATVANLDWPNSWQKGDEVAQKKSFISLIESLKEVNINTIFFQVRTECDAFYNSDYEPWSRYLTGFQGKDPGYDPLKFAIDECHKRSIELHVWLNPYRINASANDGGNYYDDKHVYREHPEWAIEYSDGKKILNPGLPEVQQYIKKIAGDIINKYDIDGIHLDDYFYAYGGTPVELDNDTYLTYGSQYATIGDFRRGSINKMVENIMDTILATKPYIRFGISPFGIYGNGMNPPGIVGLNAYDVIYCDPIAWLREGTVDYINPQLYWPTGGNQDFATLLPWWAEWAHQYNRNLYAGHGIYRMDDNPALSYYDFNNIINEYKDFFNLSNLEAIGIAGWSLEEIVRQINIVRENNYNNALGSVFFRAKDFDRIKNLKTYLLNNVYQYKTLLPEQHWKNSNKPGIVTNIRFEKAQGESYYNIVWDNGDSLSRYAIYKVENNNNSDYALSKNLVDVSFSNYYKADLDTIIEDISIGVVKVNRFWKKGDNSLLFKVPKPEKPLLQSPYNNFSQLSKTGQFIWNISKNASSYEIEFSPTATFDQIDYKFKTNDTTLNVNLLYLEGETDYFWRVRGVNIAGYSDFSDIWKVTTGFPSTPGFVYPHHLEEKVSLNPEFLFDVSSNADSLFVQISKGGSKFDELRIVIDTVLEAKNNYISNYTFIKYTTYYARIRAKNELGESNWSEVIKFKTLMPAPTKTQIISPKNNTGLNEDLSIIEFTWNESINATYYVFEIAEDIDFTKFIVSNNVYQGLKYSYSNPIKKKWLYARVAGKNIGGIGEWSDAIKFTVDNSVGTDDFGKGKAVISIFPNPCKDTFFLKSENINGTEELLMQVYNSSGNKIIEKSFFDFHKNNIKIISTEQLICKPCFIHITTKDFTKTFKLFKL